MSTLSVRGQVATDISASLSTPISSPTTHKSLRLTPIAAIILVGAMRVPLGRWADSDIFWHLSNGRLMVRDGVLPTPDQFSWSMQGHHVALHSIQMDRLFYLIWELGGATALAVFSSVLLMGCLLPFFLAIGRMELKPIIEAVSLLLLAFVFMPFTGARPHLMGVLFMGLLMLLLVRPFDWKKTLASASILGLWVNVHGSFLFGFAFIGMAVLAWWLSGERRDSARAFLAFLLGAAATAASPYGFELWTMGLRVSSQPLLSQINQDWKGLRPFTPEHAAMGLLIAAACALGIWRGWEPKAMVALLLILPTIQYSRFSVFGAPLLLIASLERLVHRAPESVLEPANALDLRFGRRATTVVSVAILAIGALTLAASTHVDKIEDGAMLPVPNEAVTKLLTCGSPAPVWNDFNWGSYLIWRSDGKFTTSIDSRSEALYSLDAFVDYLIVTRGQVGYEDIVEQSPAQYSLMSTTAAPLADLPGWQTVYRDNIAVLGVRDGAVWNCAADPEPNA